MGKRRNIAWIFGLMMLILIFIRPQETVDGAQRAMQLWYTGVAPAMLPFLALTPMITCPEACLAYRKIFSGIMKGLFRLPGEAAPAVIAAMISGSPGGALTICGIYASGGISQQEAARISLACAGVSPAWLVLGVGCGMLGSKTAGWKLAVIQAAVQLFLLKLLEKVEIHCLAEKRDMQKAFSASPMRTAVETVLCVCGYMCVFSAYGSAIASFAGKDAGTGLLAVLDLPAGLGRIAEKGFPGDSFAMGAAVGFGGLCIAAQNMERLKGLGVRWKDYIAIRLTAGAVCSLLCGFALENIHPGSTAADINGKIYVISLLAAGICAVPGLIFLSKNIFLNKRKVAGNSVKMG